MVTFHGSATIPSETITGSKTTVGGVRFSESEWNSVNRSRFDSKKFQTKTDIHLSDLTVGNIVYFSKKNPTDELDLYQKHPARITKIEEPTVIGVSDEYFFTPLHPQAHPFKMKSNKAYKMAMKPISVKTEKRIVNTNLYCTPLSDLHLMKAFTEDTSAITPHII
jgi:hypothetical protein